MTNTKLLKLPNLPNLPELVLILTLALVSFALPGNLAAQTGGTAFRIAGTPVCPNSPPSTNQVLSFNGTCYIPTTVSGVGSGVSSWKSRTGAVVPVAGDYTASEVTNVPAGTVAAINIQAAIDELAAEKTAVGHTHAASDTTSGVFGAARLGTGTANNTVFLRGDLVWSPITGGGDLLAANNLSDLLNAATARANLGLAAVAASGAKADVGLGSVDNTSDATKNAATATLTNKTITAPILTSYTIATLPGSPATGMIAPVTDATTAGSCTNGGGSAKSLCRYNGSAWEGVGDGGSGGGSGVGVNCPVSKSGNTVTMTASGCSVQPGNLAPVVPSGDVQIPVTGGGGNGFVGFQAGVFKVWHNVTVGTCVNIVCVGSTTTPPDDAVVWATFPVTSGTVGTIADWRSAIKQDAMKDSTSVTWQRDAVTGEWVASSLAMMSPMTTRGDIIYQGASGPTRLPKGTTGQVLTQGASDPAWGAAPSGGSGSWFYSAAVAPGAVSGWTVSGATCADFASTTVIICTAPANGVWQYVDRAAPGSLPFTVDYVFKPIFDGRDFYNSGLMIANASGAFVQIGLSGQGSGSSASFVVNKWTNASTFGGTTLLNRIGSPVLSMEAMRVVVGATNTEVYRCAAPQAASVSGGAACALFFTFATSEIGTPTRIGVGAHSSSGLNPVPFSLSHWSVQ